MGRSAHAKGGRLMASQSLQSIGARDLKAILDFLDGAYAAEDVDAFGAHFVRSARSLWQSDGAAYNEVNLKAGRIRWISDWPTIPDAERIFEQFIPEHPQIREMMRNPDGPAITINDLMSEREWRSSGIYTDFYRPHRIERVLAHHLDSSDLPSVFVLFRTGGADFSERDRALLTLLQPHLLRAYRHAEALTQYGELFALLGRGIDETGGGAILLGPDERIRSITDQARRWIGEYFGDAGAALPDQLLQWLQAARLPASLSDRLPTPLTTYVVQ